MWNTILAQCNSLHRWDVVLKPSHYPVFDHLRYAWPIPSHEQCQCLPTEIEGGKGRSLHKLCESTRLPLSHWFCRLWFGKGSWNTNVYCMYTRANSCVDSLLTEHRRQQRVCLMADTYIETSLCYFTKMPQVLKDYAWQARVCSDLVFVYNS